MNIKTIIITGLCLIMLINPVLGNTEIDNPKDYRLTEVPHGYKLSSEGHHTNEDWKYYQEFSTEGTYNEHEYCHISVCIYSLLNEESAMRSLEIMKRGNGVREVKEIYGLGDTAYRITDFYDTMETHKRLYFIRNHIMIGIYFADSSRDESDLFKFAELYDDKISSVLNNAPQLFASIELENGAGSTFYPGNSVIYYITLSDDAHVLIENQANYNEWTVVESRFYNKGQHTLYAYVENYDLGNEKLRLTATSLKGSKVISTVSFITKEREIATPIPTINSNREARPNKTPFLNPFIVINIIIILSITMKKSKGEQK